MKLVRYVVGTLLLVPMALVPAGLAHADLKAALAERDLGKRSKLALDNASSAMKTARSELEKGELEKRLAQLHREKDLPQSAPAERQFLKNGSRARRKYPQVLPKYQNPNKPFETWSGRGKQPRWVTAALKAGRTIEDLAIVKPNSKPNKAGRRSA